MSSAEGGAGWRRDALAEERDTRQERRTVDGDGDGLGESVAIAADKGRDLRKFVVLQDLRAGLFGVDLDNLELEAVGLRNGEDGRGAGVELCDKLASACTSREQSSKTQRKEHAASAYLPGEDLSERRHGCGEAWCWK